MSFPKPRAQPHDHEVPWKSLNYTGVVGDTVRRVGVDATSFSSGDLMDYNKTLVWLDLKGLIVESWT